MGTPDFEGMPNLEYLYLVYCTSLEEVHHSLKHCGKLIRLNFYGCKVLTRFPYVNVESLEYLDICQCSSLEEFPEIVGRMKPELEIHMRFSGIRELPSSIIQYVQTCRKELDLSKMKNLVAFPSSFGMLKGLVKLDVSCCSKLESLPEEIGDLENLEELHAAYTLISRPPSTIVRLNKLKFLRFEKEKSEDGVMCFVFPEVNGGLRSLEYLNLSYCNLIDGGLPEDIGCLSSLKELYLKGNNFEHLPQSIAKLGMLRCLYLMECSWLTQLPELPPELDELHADCHMALIESIHNLVTKMMKKLQLVIFSLPYDAHDTYYNGFAHSLFQNLSSLQHENISASVSLPLKVLTIGRNGGNIIPSWFQYQGMDKSVSFNLPENWYARDNFLGFAVCYNGSLIETKAFLIPICNRMSWMIRILSSSNHLKFDTESTIHFFFVPFTSLWDTSKANDKTPNDYRFIGLTFSGQIKKFGFHLLYKDEFEALLQRRENNDEPTDHCIGTRRSRYDEASCSSSKKQRSQTLQLFPTSP